MDQNLGIKGKDHSVIGSKVDDRKEKMIRFLTILLASVSSFVLFLNMVSSLKFYSLCFHFFQAGFGLVLTVFDLSIVCVCFLNIVMMIKHDVSCLCFWNFDFELEFVKFLGFSCFELLELVVIDLVLG